MKYFYIYYGLLIGIIIFLFIRSTTIREGAKGRKKKKNTINQEDDGDNETDLATQPVTTQPTATQPTATQPTATQPTAIQPTATQPITTQPTATQPITTQPTATQPTATQPIDQQTVQSILEKITPAILKPYIDNIKQSQDNVTQMQDELMQLQSNLNNKTATINNQQKQLNTDLNNVTSYYKDLSSNMLGQYTMYKTALANESSLGLSSIKSAVQTAQTSADIAKDNATVAQTYANKTQTIYNNVFGNTTANVVHNDLAVEGFSVCEGLSSIYTTDGTTPGNIFKLEEELVSAINDFNTQYAQYMRCKATTCTQNTVSEDTIKNKATAIQAKVQELKNAYATSSNDITGATYENNHRDIMDKANQLLQTRAELDAKIANIMQPASELNRFYDSTIYSKIVLSVLASSIAYYIITN